MLLIRALALMLILTGCAVGKLDARQAFALHEQAETLYQQGEYLAALPLFQQMARRFPRDAEFQLRIGNCYAFDGQYEQAVSAYEVAVTIDPRHSRAWYNLSYVRAQMLAATVMRMLQSLDPTDPEALRMKKLAIAVLEPFGSAVMLQLPDGTELSPDKSAGNSSREPAPDPAVMEESNGHITEGNVP